MKKLTKKEGKKEKPDHKHSGLIYRIDERGSHYRCEICCKNLVLTWIEKGEENEANTVVRSNTNRR